MTGLAFPVAFGAGALAALNPCGLALLPAWLARAVTPAEEDADALDRMLGALPASLAMSAGFALVIAPLGALAGVAIGAAARAAPWLGLGVGALLVLSGILLLAGHAQGTGQLTQRLSGRGGPMTLGAAYALVSLGCTLPAFLLAVGTTAGASTAQVAVRISAYVIGATIVLTAASLLAATAAGTAPLRGLARHAPSVSAALLIVSGAFIAARQLRLVLATNGTAIPANLPVLAASAAMIGVLAWALAWRGERH